MTGSGFRVTENGAGMTVEEYGDDSGIVIPDLIGNP
jgi:hypothetical protein